MEDRGLGDLSNRNRFSYNLGDWKSEIKVSTSVFLLRPRSSACKWHPLPVSSHGLPSVRVCVLISSSYKDTRPIGSGLTLMTSFYLNRLSKDPVSKYSHILKSWDWDVNTEIWERQNSVHNRHS